MRRLVPILLNCLHVLRIVLGQELSVTRHAAGDIFTIEGSCTEACAALSSGTASSFFRNPSNAGLYIPDNSCSCQCNVEVPVFREDLHICVNDIHECDVAGFMNSSGDIEKVPYVFLPQRGQIIYPQTEIRFEGVKLPVCGITGAQQLGKGGWIELKNLSSPDPPFKLYHDEGRTFLQWTGEAGLREATEGKLVVAKLICRDAFPGSTHPEVFTPCVAFRVAGSLSKNSVREVMFSSSSKNSQGLSAIEYTAIGISSILLALIYVASVSLYLHSRKSRRKSAEEPEVAITSGRDGAGLVKNNPLLAASRHFESDSALSESDLGDELPQSDGEQGFENVHVTSALIHSHYDCSEISKGSSSILGEKIPEENVRIVETVENAHQQEVPVLPGVQRRKLYFNPAYFDRQLLLAPPPAAIEFLLKIREVIAIAKHKMNAKKFVPSLGKIPEEDSVSEQCSSSNKQKGSSAVKSKKSQRCSGCPGCLESRPNLPPLPENTKPILGESRVRAWLEDVTPPERNWKDPKEEEKYIEESTKSFARNLEYLKEITNHYDFHISEESSHQGQSFSSWKDNPPMLRTFRHAARSEILENDDKFSMSQRSTKSMFEEPLHDKFQRKLKDGFASCELHENSEINAKVRKAIENSFIKQLEENVTLEELKQGPVQCNLDVQKIEVLSADKPESEKLAPVAPHKKPRKSKTPSAPKKHSNLLRDLPNGSNTAKRIMDAVIREMVDVKALEPCSKSPKMSDYEVDSLERSKTIRKPSTSPESANQPSPTSSTALPMEEELTIQNATINTQTGEATISRQEFLKKESSNLPEILSQKDGYALVSEVYVNDGYTSPTGSEDSGPEISYEPENPGHLTIKVQDSPRNYVKLDESEYEPDTLDRKPMKLKINGDVHYEKETQSEVFVDSLERPAQILLRTKGSFKDEDSMKNGVSPLQRGYGSLRAIYEARLKSSTRDADSSPGTRSLNNEVERSHSWRKNRYLTPDNRHARRQRKPQNQPDVVPMPPSEKIYQRPKEPRRVDGLYTLSKNDWGRSRTKMENPTASDGAPVPKLDGLFVGTRREFSNYYYNNSHVSSINCNEISSRADAYSTAVQRENNYSEMNLPWKFPREKKFDPSDHLSFLFENEVAKKERSLSSRCRRDNRMNLLQSRIRSFANSTDRCCSKQNANLKKVKVQKKTIYTNPTLIKMEDSGYLSSTDSNGSRKQLLAHDVSSVSETDETESLGDGASESGAESVGTDSVFFGNFRKLSEISNFSKSIDSGVDVEVRNPFFQPFGIRNEGGVLERTAINTSESEAESFDTVLNLNSCKKGNFFS